MSDALAQAQSAFASAPAANRWWVALSGGLDSVALLDLAQSFLSSHPGPELAAIHVHHGLHVDADHWQQHCQALCDARAIPLTVIPVSVMPAGGGVESAARNARYRAFEGVLQAGDLLLVAQHADDQAETVLYRLLRGAGPRGLAGMPRQRRLGQAQLYRPLLDIPRAVLEAWAEARQLRWVEDPSNADSRFDRNFLRHDILPRLNTRWPGAREAITRAAALQREAVNALEALPLRRTHTVFGEPALIIPPAGEPSSEPVEAAVTPSEQPAQGAAPALDMSVSSVPSGDGVESLAGQVHRWLSIEGWHAPPRERMLEFARQCLEAPPDRAPLLRFADTTLRRWRGHIVRTARDQPSLAWPAELTVGESLDIGAFRLTWEACDTGWGFTEGMSLQVCGRAQVHRVAPLFGPHRSYKQLCQERGVPPWWRDQLPLLARDGVLVAAPVLGVLAGRAQWPRVEDCATYLPRLTLPSISE